MGLEDLFSGGSSGPKKKPLLRNKEPKKRTKEEEKEDQYVEQNKENIQQRVQEKIKELTEKVERKTQYKKSVYEKIEKEDLFVIGDLITQKVLSFERAFERIKEVYGEEVPEIKTMKWHSFRYFLITRKIVHNPKSLESIHKGISKSAFAQSRRERIVKDVIEELFENHMDKIIEELKKRM